MRTAQNLADLNNIGLFLEMAQESRLTVGFGMEIPVLAVVGVELEN